MTRAQEEKKVLKLAVIAALALLIIFSVTQGRAQTVVTGGGSGGTTINATNGVPPTRSSATAFRDSTSTDIINLFSTCSGTQYLGADGACHAAGSGTPCTVTALALQFNNSGAFGCVPGWTTATNGGGTTNAQIAASVTESLSGAQTAKLLDLQYNPTVASTVNDIHILNLGGTFSIHGGAGQTMSGIYSIHTFNVLDGTSSHILDVISRANCNASLGATINLCSAFYGTAGTSANAGTNSQISAGSFSFDPLVTSSALPSASGITVSMPPIPTGGGSLTVGKGVEVSDTTVTAGAGGTAACEICAGGSPSGSDIIPMYVFASNANRTVTNIARFSGGTLQSTGPILISGDVNAIYSSSANTVLQLLKNGGNVFESWHNGTFGMELGITGSNFTLSRGNGGINIFTIDPTSGLMTMSQTFKITQLNATNLLFNTTAPTVTGFGTSPSVATNNGTAAFTINVGTGGTATNGVINLPTAANGWGCDATDLTTQSATVFVTKQTASSTTSATIGNFNTSGAAAAWAASDILSVKCTAR